MGFRSGSRSTVPQLAAPPAVEPNVGLTESTAVSAGIYYRDRLFTYPLSATNALKHLGPIDVALTGISYLRARVSTQVNQVSAQFGQERTAITAEDWLIEQFGTRLYRIFFKSYFRKVWGVSAEHLSADCAVQSVLAVRSQAFLAFSPRWESRHQLVNQADSTVEPSTTPAAGQLQYRSLIVVDLIESPSAVDSMTSFPQQLYIHSPEVAVSRIQRYGNRLKLSYVCATSDPLWLSSNSALINLAICELVALRLVADESSYQVASGTVMRRQPAYRVQTVDA